MIQMNVLKKFKKAIPLLLASGLLAVSLSGCGGGNEEDPMPIPTIEPISQPPAPTTDPGETTPDEAAATNSDVIGERTVVDGKMQSYLTGEWKDEEVVNRRPIAVMVPNDKGGLPQFGISRASIIYEAPVEGRMTRVMPVFEDFDDLERIGPVRSSRDYFLYVAMGYDAIYCNHGLAVPYVAPIINTDRVDNISAATAGIDTPADRAFARYDRAGYAYMYTSYLVISRMKDEVERLGYRWDLADNYQPQFLFAADGVRAEHADMPDATKIYPGGTGSNNGGYGVFNPYFEYNPEDHLYYRFQSGSKQIDEMTGEQLTFSNVVLQYGHGEVRDAKDYLAFDVHEANKSKALVFTNGKVIEATWTRAADEVPAQYYDADGNEIVVNQGKTWICQIWQENDYVEYE